MQGGEGNSRLAPVTSCPLSRFGCVMHKPSSSIPLTQTSRMLKLGQPLGPQGLAYLSTGMWIQNQSQIPSCSLWWGLVCSEVQGSQLHFCFGFLTKSEALTSACNKDVPRCQYKHYNQTDFPVDCVEIQLQGSTTFCISTVKNNDD